MSAPSAWSTDVDVAYWEHPDQIIWIELPHHRLWGYDNYWVDWPRYGMFNDPENYGWYRGEQVAAWEWRSAGTVRLDDPAPPHGVEVLRGFMLRGDAARFVSEFFGMELIHDPA